MSKVVYIHRKADDNTVFYIGMGFLNRAYDFTSRSAEWKKAAEKGVNVTIYKQYLTRKEAIVIENRLIKYYGLNNLANKSVGGEGGHISKYNKAIDQYDSNGNLLNSFISIKQAERKTKVPHSNISKCLSKERDYAGGFFWVKKGERPNVKKMKNVNINSLVLDLNTGVFYNSSREVSELYGIKYVTLWRYLTGKRKNKTNFEYV